MGTVPITRFLKAGADGQLSFVRRRAVRRSSMCPSVTPFGLEERVRITIWLGPTNHRVVIGQMYRRAGVNSGDVVVSAASAAGAIQNVRDAKQEAREFLRVLTAARRADADGVGRAPPRMSE